MVSQVFHHVQRQRNLHVGLVVHTQRNRSVVLLSTDLALAPLRRARADKARFHMAFICHDAQQLPGFSDCQARAKAQRDFHLHARLRAGNIAKLAARQQQGDTEDPLSMARLKRRAFNHHRLDRIVEH